MASQNSLLVSWVKGAYGMELGLAPMLEQQTQRLADDPEFRKNLSQHLSQHLEKTRQHASLLRERLSRMGEDVSTIRPIEPITTALGHVNGGKPDPARQTELLDYVTETFEVASYRALQSLAEMLGDQETSRVCEQILADEQAISDALSRRLPGHNGHNGYKDAQATIAQENVTQAQAARDVLAALNAHDLDRFDKLLARDFRAEMPGDPRPADRKANRARLESFFKAFPDLHYEVNRVAPSGDSVFVEWTAAGTHSGPFTVMESTTIPATNKKVKFGGVTIFRFENGKVTHSRIISDSGRLMRQLGVVPGSEKAAAPSTSVGRDIVHLEIPAKDRKVAARFYGELFGWEYEHMDESMKYTTFKSGTLPGGFPDVSETNPAGEVIIYVYSKDIESDLRRAKSLGGKMIVPRTEIPGYGWFAILSDPSGNRVGLYDMKQPA